MPILFVSYVIAYVDRVNIGFAKLQMLNDLGFSAAVYGLGAGIFFIGFMLFEMPSNLILYKVGARLWIARIMVTWGLISVLTMYVKTPTAFYAMRFLLGVAEAGFVPGVVYYLTQWYPQKRQGRIMSTLIAAAAVGGILVGPLSGYIMDRFDNVYSMHNWQWLFLLQGSPAVLLGILVWCYLEDSPKTANWLSDEEKELHFKILQADKSPAHQKSKISEVLREKKLWLISAVLVAINIGIYSVVFWTPTIIKSSGVQSYNAIGWISAIPYTATAIAMLAMGRSSDFFQDRRWHIAIACFAGAAGLVGSVYFASSPVLAIASVALATAAFIASTPLIWALGSTFMSERAAAVGFALMNALAAIGGFSGPYLMGIAQDLTGSTTVSVLGIAGCAVAGSLLVLLFPPLRPSERRS